MAPTAHQTVRWGLIGLSSLASLVVPLLPLALLVHRIALGPTAHLFPVCPPARYDCAAVVALQVLQVAPNSEASVIKKAYRKLSILVHPDKNRDDPENALKAFEEVNAAKQMIDDEDKMSYVNEMIAQGEDSAKEKLKELRTEARRLRKTLPEDEDPEARAKFVRRVTMKLFADYHKRKEELAGTEEKTKKRFQAEVEEAREKKRVKQEAEKTWEAGQDARMSSWSNFAKSQGVMGEEKKKKKKKDKYMPGMMKRPKLKTEQRSSGP